MNKRIGAIFLMASLVTYAQNQKFGEVTVDEINEKSHKLDSSAPAAIVYKKGRIEMEYNNQWSYKFEVESRIKIYKKEGYNYAEVQVPIYIGTGGGSKEKFSGLKAFTYNLDGGKVVKEKIKSDGEFEEKINERWMLKKFTFPNVKEGSVLEYSYVINSPYINSLPEWDFQHDIPTDYSEYVTNIPEYFNYKEFTKGYSPIQRNQESQRKEFKFRYEDNDARESAVGAHRSQTGSLDYTLNITKYVAGNLPKLVDEKYVNNIDNYRSSLKLELAWSRMTNSPVNYYNQSWEDVAKKVYNYDNFGRELAKTGYFEDELNPLLQQAGSNPEKLAVVLNFMKQKMTWNGNYGFSCANGVKEAYKANTGNVGEINLMLTSMLRHAGFNANPVLVSTRSHGIPFFPTTEGFNYVISAVEIENGLILLDATSKFGLPNILPERALNWFGRLVRKDGSSAQVNLMPNSVSKENITLNADLKEDGHIDGKFRKQYTDHNALLFRQFFTTEGQDKYLETLENYYGDIETNEYVAENTFELGKPVLESFSFSKDNAVDVIADKMYLNPLLFLSENENPFKLETREFPVDFSYPRSSRTMVNIKLPENYRVESMPAPVSLALPENMGGFKFMISNTGNMLQVMLTSEINEAIIPPGYYSALKEYYNQLVSKQTEKVVLTKI